MTETAVPVVTLLYGEDEFGIAQALEQSLARLGAGADRSLLEMNTTRLEGSTATPEQVLSAAAAMPFLAERRVVILSQPFSRLKERGAQRRFLDILEQLPPTSALLLIHNDALLAERDRRAGKTHWFEDWAVKHTDRAAASHFPLLQGEALARRIQDLARQIDGQITRPGAELLGALTDGDTRLAMQELPKLLAYVNYARPINEDDVQELTANTAEGDIFSLVDALSAKNKRAAFGMLERLLETKDYWEIFPMIVRQFRLLLLAQAVLQRGGSRNDLLPFTSRSTFVADKMLQQARRFNGPELERAYHRLLELDLAIKSGGAVSDRVALETFVGEWG